MSRFCKAIPIEAGEMNAIQRAVLYVLVMVWTCYAAGKGVGEIIYHHLHGEGVISLVPGVISLISIFGLTAIVAWQDFAPGLRVGSRP